MKVCDYVAEYLEARGVRHAFTLTGALVTRIVDAIHTRTSIDLVNVHFEQAAAFAAEGVGRMTGIPGVAIGTGGPGATNLITGIGSCYYDSVPAVFIAGQTDRHSQVGDRPIRQLGNQECDIVSIVKPITKAAWQVDDPERIEEYMERAFQTALEGRPGPVLLAFPMDVQGTDVEVTPPQPVTRQHTIEPEQRTRITDYLLTLQDKLDGAKRPIILAGHGVRLSGAIDPFRRFVEATGIPVVNSILGMDVLAYDHPQRVGLLGINGNRWSNLAMAEADLVLVLGSRLQIRQTTLDVASFCKGREIFHVDVDPGEINNRVKGCSYLVAHLAEFLDQALLFMSAHPQKDRGCWLDRIAELKASYPDTAELGEVKGINPNRFMHVLSQGSKRAGAFVTDVGMHTLWAVQSVELQDDQRMLVSAGMGSMGFGLPAAIGACFASGRPSVLIAGDSGIQINIQEFQTLVRRRVPVKMIIMNNESQGMITTFQDKIFDSRYVCSLWDYNTPDLPKLAEVYGIPGHCVRDESDMEAAVEWLWQQDGPALLDVKIPTHTEALPIVKYGQYLDQMNPAEPVNAEEVLSV